MFGLEWLIIGAVIAGGAAIAKGIAADVEKQNALQQQQAEAAIAERARTQQYNYQQGQIQDQLNNQLQTMKDQLIIDRERTYGQVKDSFKSTYLGQLQAEMGYMDQQQQGAEALGGVSAAEGAAGTKSNSRLSGILQEQLSERSNLARQGIDRGLRSAVGQAEQARDQFKKGSSYMNMYQNRVSQLQSAAGKDLAYSTEQYKTGSDMYASRSSYLAGAIQDSAWYNPLNLLGNTLNGLSVGFNTYSGLSSLWGSGGISPPASNSYAASVANGPARTQY